MKSKILYKIGLLCGIIPLIGGISIFCYWWAQRALYAENYSGLFDIGIPWAAGSFFAACLGLVFMLIVLVRNKDKYLKYSLLGFFVLFVNIPAVIGVVFAMGEIERRVYVRIHNDTGFKNVEFALTGPGCDNFTHRLDNGESAVFYFYPKHVYKSKRVYEDNDPNLFVLTVKYEQIIRKIKLGRLDYGGCLHLDVDNDFKLADTDQLIYY